VPVCRWMKGGGVGGCFLFDCTYVGGCGIGRVWVGAGGWMCGCV